MVQGPFEQLPRARPCSFSSAFSRTPPRPNLTQRTLKRFPAPSLFAAAASNVAQAAKMAAAPPPTAAQLQQLDIVRALELRKNEWLRKADGVR